MTVGLSLMGMAQTANRYSPATEMPSDRRADSYAIYQRVLPSNAIEWSEVHRSQWLLQDDTTAKPLSEACDASGISDLPKAVMPPAERKAEWQEVLDDFAEHCHDRYRLDAANSN
jgi:hypothetical protein